MTVEDYLRAALSKREWIWVECALKEIAGSVACDEVEQGRLRAVEQLGKDAWYSIELRATLAGLEVVHAVGLRGHDVGSLQVWGEGGSLDDALADARIERKPWRPAPRRAASR